MHQPYHRTIPILCAALCLMILALACSMPGRPGVFGPTFTPSPSPTLTSTPTPIPTPTLPPTPTLVPAARIDSGEHALMSGDWERALQEYQSAQQTSSDPEIQAAALLGMGRAQLLQRDYRRAIDTLETLIHTYPETPHLAYAHFFVAQAYSAVDRHTDAAQAYLNYLVLRHGVVDAYVLDLRGDALFAAGDYAGAANDYLASLSTPSLNDAINIQMKIARSYALSANYTEALKLYDQLYYQTSNDNTKALIDLRKGQTYTAMGNIEEAMIAYQDAVDNFPKSYDSFSALAALVEAGIPVDELQRGIVDYYAGQYGQATAAFDRYLQKSPIDPGTAYYFYGLANFAQGGYNEAITHWNRVIQNYPDHVYWDDAWEQKAYIQWAYLEQYTQAIKTLLDFVDQAPTHARAAEFLFDAALAAERGGDLEQAAELWGRVINHYPASEQAPRALFLAGVTHYRLKNYKASYLDFERYQTIAASIGDRAAAYLWSGKSLLGLDDPEGAKQLFQQAAATDPTGYYSERARDLMSDRKPFSPPQALDLAADLKAERVKADEWMRSTFVLPENTDLSGLGVLAEDPYLLRGEELWHLGLYEEARAEFEQLRKSLENDPEQTYRLTDYLYQLGLYRSAGLAARQVLTLAGLDDASSLTAPMYFNRLRFGAHYSEIVLPLAEQYDFDPLFIFSVVRQESMFESFVQSSAAANGLMQIMAATGADIAKNLGWPPDYTEADLYRPLVSLTFGVDYLDTQRRAFNNDPYAILAAYNAGPGNAASWKNLAGDDPDVFLETIRYEETRNYIRGIYEVYTIYKRLYDRAP